MGMILTISLIAVGILQDNPLKNPQLCDAHAQYLDSGLHEAMFFDGGCLAVSDHACGVGLAMDPSRRRLQQTYRCCIDTQETEPNE